MPNQIASPGPSPLAARRSRACRAACHPAGGVSETGCARAAGRAFGRRFRLGVFRVHEPRRTQTILGLLGADFALAQGAGGNTSFKHGDLLTIKASGFRLGDAGERDIFVDVPVAAARAMADGGPAHADAGGRRASIETSLHAVLPQRAVAHLHMIPLLALAVRADAAEVLAARLAGLDWALVPYLKPGVAVAQAVRALVAARGAPGVVVLANHGIVFAGDGFEQVAALVDEVRARVDVAPRAVPAADPAGLAALAGRHALEPARVAAAHGAALDPAATGFATAGSLYPDHVVFLGRGAALLGAGEAESLLFLAPGKGALLAPGLSDEAHEMAACLAEVALRIDPGAPLSLLGREAEDELIHWDAELYRRALADEAG
ncbi:MAG: class II aldolase/adducin family protein [Sphingomonas sp.]